MKEATHKIRGPVYLATYEHGHGTDYSIHVTYEGAKLWIDSVAGDWKDSFVDTGTPEELMSSSELADSWGEVTCGSEWLNIIEVELQN